MPERKIRQIEKLMAELTAELEARREPEDPNIPRWKRWWRAFVIASRKSVILTVRSAAGATVIVVVGFFALRHQNDVVADQRVSDNARAAQEALFDTASTAYTTSVIQRTLCLDSVAASLRNRGQWELTVDILRGAGLDPEADQLSAGPVLIAPPRSVDECPATTPVPIDPNTRKPMPVDPVTSLPLSRITGG